MGVTHQLCTHEAKLHLKLNELHIRERGGEPSKGVFHSSVKSCGVRCYIKGRTNAANICICKTLSAKTKSSRWRAHARESVVCYMLSNYINPDAQCRLWHSGTQGRMTLRERHTAVALWF